ncbi:MAG: 3' terminal RNA ribose 2'-O-methyltransferase Hen1 [Flavobacteriales bacterium]
MYLKIKVNNNNATDLGYILHKHPDKYQKEKMGYGDIHMFYTQTEATSCEFAMVLDINTIELTRNLQKKTYSNSFKLADYVNDRAFVASSFLTAAISKVLGSAMNGNCSYDKDLAIKVWDLEVEVGTVKAQGGINQIRNYFEPLNYTLEIEETLLDEDFESWGKSPYFTLKLQGQKTIQDLLSQLYVLLPVLDNNKHYYVNESEIKKLIQKGGEWLKNHPAKDIITKKYLRYKKSYTHSAFEQLMTETPEVLNKPTEEIEEKVEQKLSVHQNRLQQVANTLKQLGANSIADLGCGEGKLIRLLLQDQQFNKIVGMDVSFATLEMAKKKLKLEEASPRLKEKLNLIQGSLTYRDKRIEGFDAIALVEVIEHLDPSRLEALQRVVFEFSKPKFAVLTTPNQEYNQLFDGLKEGKFRHSDHRFEWTRQEFETWANNVSQTYNYEVSFKPIGEEHPEFGGLSQMAIFKKKAT